MFWGTTTTTKVEQFEYLVKRRNGYLKVFYAVLRKLDALLITIMIHIEKSKESITEYEDKIKDEKAGIAFLEKESKTVEAQMKQIKSFVEPTVVIKKKKE